MRAHTRERERPGPEVSDVRRRRSAALSYAVWRSARVTSHTCRVESLLDGNLYLILRPAVLNILDPPASRADDINGPRKSFQSEAPIARCPCRDADKETHLFFVAEMENIIGAALSRNFDANFNGFGLITFSRGREKERRKIRISLSLVEIIIYCGNSTCTFDKIQEFCFIQSPFRYRDE